MTDLERKKKVTQVIKKLITNDLLKLIYFSFRPISIIEFTASKRTPKKRKQKQA